MIGFFIKKNFFNGWDNFLSLIVFNLISYALLIGLYFFISLFVETPVLFFCFLFIAIYLVTVFYFSMSILTADVAHNKSVSILSLFKNLVLVWKDALFLSLLFLALFISATIALPFTTMLVVFLGLLCRALFFGLLL